MFATRFALAGAAIAALSAQPVYDDLSMISDASGACLP
jgi:hypothetical protein